MQNHKIALSFLYSLFATLFLAVSLLDVGISIEYTIGVILIAGIVAALFKKEKGAAYMAVQTEIWVRYIIQRLFKDNTFLKFASNDDQYVIGGKIVHIPNPGSKPVIVKNRASFPAAAVQRTDTDVSYILDKYTSDPTHIEQADLQEISYDKISSVFGDHAGELVDAVADDMLIKWLTSIPAPNIVRTTGAATAARVTGQTGNRKATVHDDLRRVKLEMDLQNVAKTERYGLLESNMMDELFLSLSTTQYRDFSQHANAKEGIIGRLYGFDLFDRSKVAIASSANAIDPLGSAVDTNDNVVSIFWHKESVARAMGEKKFFEKTDDPLYYGNIYSALLRAGGRRKRADDAGVIALIQDVAP